MNHYFAELGLDADADERTIKRAYAARLKLIDVEKNPAAFQTLRKIFEGALWYARHTAYHATANAEAETATDPESPGSAPIAQPYIDAIDATVNNVIAPSLQPAESAPKPHRPPRPTGWASLENSGDDDVQLKLAVNIIRSTRAVDSREVAASMVTDARQKLASFAAQENFELDVARYIAAETGYTAASILGVADAMGWNDDQLHSRDRLITLDANLAHQVEQKLFAARGLNYLYTLKTKGQPAGRTLLGKYRPTIFRFEVFGNDDLAKLNRFIDEFRWVDFSSFSNAPDPRVIDWWKEHGSAPRITVVKLGVAAIAGVFVGNFVYDIFNTRNLALSSNALLAFAILIDLLIGVTILASAIGLQYLWARYSVRYRHHFSEKKWLADAWLRAAPIVLAFALLWPNMPYWEVSTALCVMTIFWIKQSVLKFWNWQEIAVSAVFPGLPAAAWVASFFAQSHFLLSFAAGLLVLIYALAVARQAQFMSYGDSSRKLRFTFNYGWLILLGISAIFIIDRPSSTSLIQQTGRLLWVLSVIWGAAATSFYPARLKYKLWVGIVLLNTILYKFYSTLPTTDMTGMGGFPAALSATIMTLTFFIINRIPPLNAWLQR